jgi:hypothetical protein
MRLGILALSLVVTACIAGGADRSGFFSPDAVAVLTERDNISMDVPSWFGPGAWIAYALTTLSALMDGIFALYRCWDPLAPTLSSWANEEGDRDSPADEDADHKWDPDTITSLIYTGMACGELLRASNKVSGGHGALDKSDLPVLAAACTAVITGQLVGMVGGIIWLGVYTKTPVTKPSHPEARAHTKARRHAIRRVFLYGVLGLFSWITSLVFYSCIRKGGAMPDLPSGVRSPFVFPASGYGIALDVIFVGWFLLASAKVLPRDVWDITSWFMSPVSALHIGALHKMSTWRGGKSDQDHVNCRELCSFWCGVIAVPAVLVIAVFMFNPKGAFFPRAGLDIGDIDQLGPLITVAIISFNRFVCLCWGSVQRRFPLDQLGPRITAAIISFNRFACLCWGSVQRRFTLEGLSTKEAGAPLVPLTSADSLSTPPTPDTLSNCSTPETPSTPLTPDFDSDPAHKDKKLLISPCVSALLPLHHVPHFGCCPETSTFGRVLPAVGRLRLFKPDRASSPRAQSTQTGHRYAPKVVLGRPTSASAPSVADATASRRPLPPLTIKTMTETGYADRELKSFAEEGRAKLARPGPVMVSPNTSFTYVEHQRSGGRTKRKVDKAHFKRAIETRRPIFEEPMGDSDGDGSQEGLLSSSSSNSVVSSPHSRAPSNASDAEHVDIPLVSSTTARPPKRIPTRRNTRPLDDTTQKSLELPITP